jgi:ferritin-like metal-binding protein YciE
MLAETLPDIFQRGLEFAYDGEHQLIKGMPKIIESVRSEPLKAAFDRQLEESKQHLGRLEQVFAGQNRAPAGESNHSIAGILDEAEKLIKHIDPSPLRDAALIISGNLIQHNKIGLYGSLLALARVLKLEPATRLLEQTLAEQKEADNRLSEIAVTVNQEAVGFQNTPHGFVII